jgi:hypothetical protein
MSSLYTDPLNRNPGTESTAESGVTPRILADGFSKPVGCENSVI